MDWSWYQLGLITQMTGVRIALSLPNFVGLNVPVRLTGLRLEAKPSMLATSNMSSPFGDRLTGLIYVL